MNKDHYVYILASRRNGTLYIGMTNDIKRRIWEHKHNLIPGFTKKYLIHDLVYMETFNDPEDAIYREKRLKKWSRAWKIELIESRNPKWNDLSKQFI